MPKNAKFDSDGNLINAAEMDYSCFDEWLKTWHGAKRYCIFINTQFNRFNEPIGTPKFEKMVETYYSNLASHAEMRGINSAKLIFEIFDEPSLREQITKNLLPYLRIIKKAVPAAEIFENPLRIEQVMKHSPELFKEADIFCFDVPANYNSGNAEITDARLNVIKQVSNSGKTVWLYQCAGPALSLAPSDYYRGVFWHGINYNAKGIMFWALGCTGESGSSWNPYDAKYEAYSPYFIDDLSINSSKQMEAIREGACDYEYAKLLRVKIDELRKAGKIDKAEAGRLAVLRYLIENQ